MRQILAMVGVLVLAVSSPAARKPAHRAAKNPKVAPAAGHVEGATTTVTTLESDVERIVRKAEAGGTVEASPELAARILSAPQGATVDMGDFDMEALPILPVSQMAGGPPILFADDPEYIRVPEGAALRERILPGTNRIYLYHCNGTTGTVSRITAVIENLSDQPMKLRFTRRAFPGVSGDYGRLGRMGIKGFLESQPDHPGDTRVIAPRGSAPLDAEVEASRVKFNQLIHLFAEFEIDRPARVTVLQTSPATPGPVANARITTLLPPRSRSGAGRGYFHFSEYNVTNAPGGIVDTVRGAQQIFIADGRMDRWMTGFDSTSTTMPSVLKGNYGVLYRIGLKRTAGDNRPLALMMWNARTKSGCAAMGGTVQVSAGKYPGGTVLVPTDAPLVRGGDKAVLIQIFPPPAKGKTETLEVIYSPPGASCLPTPLLLVPLGKKAGDSPDGP